MLFQAPQSEHFPTHFGLRLLHWPQTNHVLLATWASRRFPHADNGFPVARLGEGIEHVGVYDLQPAIQQTTDVPGKAGEIARNQHQKSLGSQAPAHGICNPGAQARSRGIGHNHLGRPPGHL